MFSRIKKTWKALTRKCPEVPERIYVYPAEYNRNKFVQLLAWRDTVLALDAEGKIWQIEECRNLTGSPLGLQMIMESPRSY